MGCGCVGGFQPVGTGCPVPHTDRVSLAARSAAAAYSGAQPFHHSIGTPSMRCIGDDTHVLMLPFPACLPLLPSTHSPHTPQIP